MFAQNELYTLSADRMLMEEVAVSGTEYQGQIVLGGPDAAIEIKGREIALFMHGVPTDNPAFANFVEGYHKALVNAATKLTKGNGAAVVITGKWHHVEFHCEPFFAPYAIHIRCADGAVRSQPYDIHIFDTDDAEEGRDTSISIDDLEKSEIIEWLRCSTENSLWRYGSSSTSSGHPRFSGMLWRPEDETRSSVYINVTGEYANLELQELENGEFASLFSAIKLHLNTAIEQNTITDGLRLAVKDFLAVTAKAPEEDRKGAVGRMLRIMSKSPIGIRNGHPVLRSEMPIGETATVEEIANSTTASGYWLQMRKIDGEFNEATFYLFDDHHRLEPPYPIVLRRQMATADDDFCGCLYACEWEEKGGYEFRRLAIGPVPTLSW
jgi:hypothetical protein